MAMFRGSTYSIQTDKELINNSDVLEEEVIRIALLGGPEVGKSSMLACIDNEPFREGILYTKVLQPRFKKLRINKNCIINLYTVSLDVKQWDGPGDKISEYVHDGSLDSIDGFIQVFDLTDRHSFHTIEAIHYDVKKMRKREKEGSTVCSVLVGNKSDLSQLPPEELDPQTMKEIDYLADKLAKRQNLLYLKTSAKKNHFVKDAFVELIKQIIRIKKKGSQSSKGVNTNFSFMEEEEAESVCRGPPQCRGCPECRGWLECKGCPSCRLF